MKRLSEISFEKAFVATFPGDDSGNNTPRQTPGVLYCKTLPTPVAKVSLLAWSDELANLLGIETPALGMAAEAPDEQTQIDIDILGGNLVTPTMYPYAACYAGHQFGNWAGQLGDGRAITLGEIQTPNGVWELQLKGAGRTPYSRTADGRAVLRSSLREYMMSEAMYHLGVPTTRALSLVTTGDQVMRDMFYNGNPANEPGAIVMRVAPSFLRFGNFEILAARNEIDQLKRLADWSIDRFYPHISGDNKVMDWFKEVVQRTALLMVEWTRVGFVHGVMNTDNMSILGLTIDYGPYSFVDEYDNNFTPNTTDLPGRRYAFGKQPAVAKWNLACLAGGIAPLINDDKILQEALDTYDSIYWGAYYHMMANKLGLTEIGTEDQQLIDSFEKMLRVVRPDMTIFFQLLISLHEAPESKDYVAHFAESFYRDLTPEHTALLTETLERYMARVQPKDGSNKVSTETMRRTNPRFILRNYLLHSAIEQLQNGDATLFVQLQQAMKEPYSNKHDVFFEKRPLWAAQKAGSSMLSCSS